MPMPRSSLIVVLIVALFCVSLAARAQNKPGVKEEPICIVDEIMADSVNIVELPLGLRELIDFGSVTDEGPKVNKVPAKPYTVQVYSDKSRTEANARASQVQARFPQYSVRRHYSSPYFRVYLGAFATSSEAQVLVNEVKRAFPAFANEVHWTKTSSGPSRKR